MSQHRQSLNLSDLARFLEPNPLIITPETLLSDAIALMGQKQQSNLTDCILVVAAERLKGIFTKGDVIRLLAKGIDLKAKGIDLFKTTINEVMTQPVITMARSQCQNIHSVWSFIQEHSVSYVPILGDERELLGVIAANNLIKFVKPQNLEFIANENRTKSSQDDLGVRICPETTADFSHLKQGKRRNTEFNQEQVLRKQSQNNQSDRQQANREELKRFFDIAPIMLCIAGFDGYFKRINPVFSKILGFTPSELLAEPFINFVYPEDRTATVTEVENLAAGKTTIAFENRYRTKDGAYRWLLWTAKAYVPEQIIFAAAQDITPRKQSELALKESEQRWQLALKGANDGIWDWNVQTNEVFFSRRWKEMLGFSEDEIGNTLEEWSKRVHPEDLGWVTQVIQDHFARKTPFYTSEHRLLCKDGSYKWILDRGQALWDETGNVIRMIGSHSDISQRREAEIQLQQERDFSNAVINTVGALVAVLDRQGKVVSFNRTCEQITGYSFAEIRGKPIWETLILPEEKETVQAVYQRLLRGQVPNQYENFWVAKDGSKHLISWSNHALFDSQREVEFVIATGIDVTEQRRVWNKLEHQYRHTKLLAEITRKIRMSIDIKEILATTVAEVQHLLTCDRVLIIQVRPQDTALPISESILPDLPPMLGYELADPLLMGKYLERYQQGEVLAINNLSTASISSDIKQLLAQFKIKAKLVVPILSQNELKGLLVTHQCHNPREWQEHEIQLLKQLGDQIGVALSQAQLLDNLEEMVSERTSELTTTNQLLQAEIAERQQTEIALRENQQKLTGILDNADEAIISINEQQYIQLFNQGAEKIFGYQAYDIIGQPLDILLPEACRRLHRQHIDRFIQSADQARTMTERGNRVSGLRKNGEEFPAEASIAKLQTREGILLTVMLKDITKRQQAEEKLQASKTLLTKAEKIAKIGSWEYNFANQQITWSEELFEVLNFTTKGFVPSCQAILASIHPEDLLLVKHTLKQGHTQGTPWQINYRLLLPDGKIKYLESRGEPTVDSQGRVLKVWGTIMDISQRVQAEKSLQRSEEQLRLITDALPILIAYIDNQQLYLYNNRTYEIWFGRPCSTLRGLHTRELFGEDNYQKMLPYIETALAGKAVTFEIQTTDEHQNTSWLNATYIPDLDANCQVKGFFSMVDDITDRKEIETMKSEFVSIASHEMRTPLTSIYGVIKLLCAGRLGELSNPGQKMADLALKNSDRLVRLVNDILDLERLESGKDRIERQQCDSLELIQQAVDIIESMARKYQVVIETNFQSIELWVDRDRIVQTLTNLISNAIKFSPANSKIEITCQQNNKNVLFTVKDRGRGIPSDKLEIIFERFQQVDASDSREKGGTGLGLAICRHIVEQHNGKIWAESVYGQGSTFFFTLPQP